MRKFLHAAKVHTKLLVKLGAGFFADAYNLFVIDIVLSILHQLDASDPTGMGLTSSSDSLLASATSFGAIVGMILFGVIGDYVGRKIAVLATGTLVAVGSIASALCQRSTSFPLITQLVICQALLGLGIGGEYPLSATIASERSSPGSRSRVIAGVFAMQGLGMLFSSLLPIIFLKAGISLEVTWRLLLGFGALPALVALYFRVRMHEESRAHNMATRDLFRSSWVLMKSMWKILLGCMLSWFLLDTAFYGTGEFKHAVYNSIYGTETMTPEAKVLNQAVFGLIIASIALPGYILTVVFIDKVGVGRLQLFGFLAMTCIYTGMGISVLTNAPNAVKLVIFGLTFFLCNFGPNPTTFIIPSEVFPSQIRATSHGISAASGKAGAVTGAAGFPKALTEIGLDGVMYVCAGISFAGFLVTFLLLPSRKINKLVHEDMEPSVPVPEQSVGCTN
jgi:PHS family inorganic phosphate transporter-like MFS transporter